MRTKLALFVLLVAGGAHAQGIAINHDSTLTGNGSVSTPLGADTSVMQKRVSACSPGRAIRSVDSAGAVTCETTGGITNSAGANIVMKSDGTNAVPSLLSDNASTLSYNSGKFTVDATTGNTHVDGALGATINQGGYGGIGATLNNVSTGGKSIYEFQAGDNEGTRITGFDATGYNDGDILIVFNSESKEDAGVMVLRDESSSTASTANYRIHTPESKDYYVQRNQGIALFRAPVLDAAGTPTTDHRWYVADTSRRMRSVVQNLHLYPALEVGSVTPISGTLNNWNPTGDIPGGYAWGLAGSNVTWLDHSSIHVGVDAAGATITGLYWGALAPASADVGPIKVIMNFGPGPLTLKNLDAGSDVDKQMQLPCGADLVLADGEAAIVHHPTPGTNWRLIATSTQTRLCPARMVLTQTDPAQDATTLTLAGSHINGLHIVDSATGQTPTGNNARGAWLEILGSYNATSAGQNVYGWAAKCSSSRSAGANSVDCTPIYGDCTGATGGTCRAGYFIGGEFRVTSTFVSTGSSFEATGRAFMYGDVDIGSANTNKANIWGHRAVRGTAPTLSTCGTSPAIQGTDEKGVITTGTGATACTVTFSRTHTDITSCTVTPRDGTFRAYTVSPTGFGLTVASASANYDYDCGCVAGAGCT